jgi:uncharacterized DUF497 family protein
MRLAVVKTSNKVLKYWEKMGFHLTGEVKPYSNKLINSEALIMEKELVYGVTNVGRFLTIIFTLRKKKLIWVISARDMSRKERKAYEEN